MKARKQPPRPVITGDMNVMDVIALHKGAEGVLAAYGLHCFQCAFNTMDSIEAGAMSHGLTDTDIENIVIDLQELIDKEPPKPQTITLTVAAAKALAKIAKQEKKKSAVLRVASDGQSGLCMEFDKKKPDDHVFTCPDVKNVAVVASDDILWRVGGAIIDIREGRFKLDLGSDKACACGGKCSC